MKVLFGSANTTNIFTNRDGIPKRVNKELIKYIKNN